MSPPDQGPSGEALDELVRDQIDRQGVSVLRVSDGFVLTFTTAILQKLLTAAEPSGKVIVFVKSGVVA